MKTITTTTIVACIRRTRCRNTGCIQNFPQAVTLRVSVFGPRQRPGRVEGLTVDLPQQDQHASPCLTLRHYRD